MATSDSIAAALRDQAAALQATFPGQAVALVQLAELVAGVFQQGGRLFLCGSGALAPIADLAAQHFLYRLALERPSLPAISLGHNSHLAAALARDGQSRNYHARQLRALGMEGDIVLVLADLTADPALSEVLAGAGQLGCHRVALLPAKADLPGAAPDQVFRLESAAPARLTELALTFTNLLCELVETELFGL